MGSGTLSIPPGEHAVLAIAGMGARMTCELEGGPLRLPESFRRFLDPSASVELEIRVRAVPRLDLGAGELLFDSSLHWRALRNAGDVVFELSHPPTGERYCRMAVDPCFSRAEIVFDEGAWSRLGADPSVWLLPHPLDQLLLAPALALRGVCLLHACGAAIDGEALVFAGHSGDGKTTLARLLGDEGVELLSDERVALRRVDGGFVAHGTPWPGEGDVASTASYPLGGLFILRKADRHAIDAPSERSLAAELTARAIVPYYLPDVASCVLALLGEILARAPLRALGFARAPGLRSLLGGVLTTSSPVP